MAVLLKFIFAGNVHAEGPFQNGGRSVVVLFELEQNCSWLWVVVQIVLQTVRPLGADGPPPVEISETETLLVLVVCTK